MDDRIRVSDADRDGATARLRDHFAAGRLTLSELHERISAALNAKTFGDLRLIMADLPEPAPVPPRAAQRPPWATPPRAARRHRPVLPLILLGLLVALLIPSSGWLLLAFVNLIMVLWLMTGLAAALTFGRPHRPVRRGRLPGTTRYRRSCYYL